MSGLAATRSCDAADGQGDAAGTDRAWVTFIPRATSTATTAAPPPNQPARRRARRPAWGRGTEGNADRPVRLWRPGTSPGGWELGDWEEDMGASDREHVRGWFDWLEAGTRVPDTPTGGRLASSRRRFQRRRRRAGWA